MSLTKSTILQANQGRIGSASYVLVGHEATPNLYQPVVDMRIAPNKTGTNNMVYIKGRRPLLSSVNGVQVQTNLIKCDFSVTALQNVNAEAETVELLEAIVEIIQVRIAEIADGNYA